MLIIRKGKDITREGKEEICIVGKEVPIEETTVEKSEMYMCRKGGRDGARSPITTKV